MTNIVLVSHGRIKRTAEPGEKYSEVWTVICDGAEQEAQKTSGVNLEVLAPQRYHDHSEFVSLVNKAVQKNPDAIGLPFTPTEHKFVKKMVDILKGFKGKIIAVNVPPTPGIKGQLAKIVGYVGMNERAAGKLAAFWLRSQSIVKREIIVPKHEKGHYGFFLRIEGIKDMAGDLHIEELFTGAEIYITDTLKKSLESGQKGVVTLGVRGTEAVLETEIPVPIIGMDLNDNVRSAIKDGRVLATLIQHPEQEGSLAVKMATETKEIPYREVYCGPTLITKDNIEVF